MFVFLTADCVSQQLAVNCHKMEHKKKQNHDTERDLLKTPRPWVLDINFKGVKKYKS